MVLSLRTIPLGRCFFGPQLGMVSIAYKVSHSKFHTLLLLLAPKLLYRNGTTSLVTLPQPFSEGFSILINLLKIVLLLLSFLCEDYAIGKNHKLPFSYSSTTVSHSFELVHCDVWGLCSVQSVSGYKCYVLFMDEFSIYSWLFPLKAKSEVFSIFVIFKTYVENLLGNKIKTFRTDSGGEFTSSAFTNFLLQHGISHQFSCPHTPEKNGCVERKHRHLTKTARTLLVRSKVPNKFWVETFSTTLYLINRLPISGSYKSPWEIFSHKPPDYSKLKVFSCSCYPCLKPYVTSKLDGKSKHCIFLAYSLQHKGYRCLDVLSNRIYISRHVLLNEDHFPFQDLSSLTTCSS